MEPLKEQFVIRLRNNAYWIAMGAVTGNADAAKKFDSRFEALKEISLYTGVTMAGAVIERYLRPSEREKSPAEA